MKSVSFLNFETKIKRLALGNINLAVKGWTDLIKNWFCIAKGLDLDT